MNIYTVFCCHTDSPGEVWIEAIKAESALLAKVIAVERCARDREGFEDDIHVLGVAAGIVEILEWNDLTKRGKP